MEGVIRFWTMREPGYIMLLTLFVSGFSGFANTLCFSPVTLDRHCYCPMRVSFPFSSYLWN